MPANVTVLRLRREARLLEARAAMARRLGEREEADALARRARAVAQAADALRRESRGGLKRRLGR